MKFWLLLQQEDGKRYGRDKEAASKSKDQIVLTELSKNKHLDQEMEENMSLTAHCQICATKFRTNRKVRKVCTPCRGWILHIKSLYKQMHQIQPEIEVVTIEDDEEEFHQEPEIITLDD